MTFVTGPVRVGFLVGHFDRFEEPFYIIAGVMLFGSVAIIVGNFCHHQKGNNVYREIGGEN